MGFYEETRVIDEPVGRPGDPCVMVIFGASGDLTKRKLIPALYNLAEGQVAVARIRGLSAWHAAR